ncbi:hypothetical protein BC833DRAFT_516042, partial [Globomyces pollinis-pini]
ESLITIIGMGIQLANCRYGIQHAINKPTRYNFLIATAMTIYFTAFIPLLLTSCIGGPTYDINDSIQRKILVTLLSINHNILLGISSLLYIILIQFRFQSIKIFHHYSRFYDRLFLVTTILTWISSFFVFLILLPILSYLGWTDSISISSAFQIKMGSIWSFYVLFIDNSISFIFFYIITFKQLKNGINQLKIIRELKFSLGVFTLLSWISLSFALIGAVLFSQLPMERQFFYRIGISFSTLMYSSSLIFIFNLPKII